MFRAFFLAVGLYAFILGVECLVIEKAVLHPSREATASAVAQADRTFVPRNHSARVGPLEPAVGGRGRDALFVHDSGQDAGLRHKATAWGAR